MFRADRDLLDYVTTFMAIASPLVAWLVARWTLAYQSKQKLDFQLDWKRFEHRDYEIEDYLAFRIHNRSRDTVTIKNVTFVDGRVFKRRFYYSAAQFEDDDFPFPRDVRPDEMIQVPIDHQVGQRFFEEVSLLTYLFWRCGFSVLGFETETTRANFRSYFPLRELGREFYPEIRKLTS